RRKDLASERNVLNHFWNQLLQLVLLLFDLQSLPRELLQATPVCSVMALHDNLIAYQAGSRSPGLLQCRQVAPAKLAVLPIQFFDQLTGDLRTLNLPFREESQRPSSRQPSLSQTLFRLIDIQANAHNRAATLLDQDAAHFLAVDEDIVGPFDRRGQ